RITVMQATPATWRTLLATGWQGRPGLRVLCGGEALPPGLAAQLLARGVALWNLYGPTETTIWSSCARIVAADDISAGRPIDNTQVHILDRVLRPLPDGLPGEICIGGAGVAQGYHRRPELTASRFVADPFSRQPAARLYRTGDRGRRRADGRIQVLGRFDEQLKLRGFRIEPAEVEAALARCGGVAQCVAGLRNTAGGEPALVAWVVPAAGASLSAAALRSTLRGALPEYMVPTQFVFIERLPLTASGKLDRRALPAPADALAEVAYSAPRTPAEAVLCELFAEALALHRPVGADEDFFALGGHSLLATRLVARLRSVFAVELPLRALFEAPTVAGLAARLAEAGPVRMPAPTPRAGARAVAPLAHPQQRLWFIEQLAPGDSSYHLHAAFRLRGLLDVAALEQALADLVARHETLRTSFRMAADGSGEQHIAGHVVLPLERRQLDRDDDAMALLAALVGRPFDMARAPLLRVTLLDAAPDGQLLLLVMHHIVSDGWSMAVLLGELSACYAARRRGGVPELPALPLQYADYALWQQRWLAGGEMAQQLDWWRAQLGEAPRLLRLPTDRPRPALQRHRGARLTRELGRLRVDELQQRARERQATLFMVLLAGFQALLARWTGEEDLLIGTPVAGRGRSEFEGLVGFFINTLVLRGDLRGNPTLGEIIGRVRRTALDAYAHADVPFERLVEVLQLPRDPGRTPLFQVMFNLHNEPARPLELPGLEATRLALPRRTSKFDLGVSLVEHANGLGVTFEYDTDLFDAVTIGGLAAGYLRMLEALACDPDQRLGDVVLVERVPEKVPVIEKVPVTISGKVPISKKVPVTISTPSVPVTTCLHGNGDWHLFRNGYLSRNGDWHLFNDATLSARFAAVAAVDPGRLAVSDGQGSWSYGELNRRVEQVAARVAGTGARGAVALLLGQDRVMVAGVLGTLRAGCAYVPLDPHAPRARQEQILAGTGARVVVTDAPRLATAPWLLATGLALVRADEETGVDAPLPPLPGDPDAPAYILHTSGTTGTPKAICQSQRNVLGLIGSWSTQLGIGPEDRLGLFSGYGYDAAVQDIFGALLNGASLHLLDLRGGSSAPELVDRIADERLTLLHFTPTVYRYLFGGR
ncbi:MAG: AMP-binding protein, partial [Gammaproteobacteria bacterium]|nr:AMP-binding protein [Gammaproteobacteria bacterium]